MTAYWIANIEVIDEKKYSQYSKKAGEAINEHGGICLALGGIYEQLEGRDRSRNVIAQFPTLDAAKKCYNSKKYQEGLRLAEGLFKRDVVIVEGTD